MNIQILTLIALAIFAVYALCISVLELAHALFRQPMVQYEQFIYIDGCSYKTGKECVNPKGDYPKTIHLRPIEYDGYCGVEVDGDVHECDINSTAYLFWMEVKP